MLGAEIKLSDVECIKFMATNHQWQKCGKGGTIYRYVYHYVQYASKIQHSLNDVMMWSFGFSKEMILKSWDSWASYVLNKNQDMLCSCGLWGMWLWVQIWHVSYNLLYVLVLVYSHWEATHTHINARSARFWPIPILDISDWASTNHLYATDVNPGLDTVLFL